MISINHNISYKAVIDGSICFPQPLLAKSSILFIKLFYKLLFNKLVCKVQIFLLGLSKKRTFTDIQKQLYKKYFNAIKKETLYNIYNTYMGSYVLKSTIKDSKTDIVYMYGSNELKCVKKSAIMVKDLVPSLKIIENNGKNHGELVLYYPDEFLSILYGILE